MRIAALITAAGISARTGQFKPMSNLGSISIAQRVVTTFHQARVDRIVMVTGYQAEALERSLSGNRIIFLRNENYETTFMFDSVKIGLNYLKDKCDAVLITPVDIPLFTVDTLFALMNCGESLACPEFEGRKGHPILVHASLFSKILTDCGERGLKGALDRIGQSMVRIPVKDPGTLLDADTSENCSKLLKRHNDQLIRPEIKVALVREKPFFDGRTEMLLMLIDETKSVRTAGKQMQLSYSSCWNMIKTLESQLSCCLVERSQGGAGGSASCLTPEGKKLLRQFHAYEKKLQEQAQLLYDDFFGSKIK